ncbi:MULTISPECIES: hypothetical protein [Kocuria]|uniref:Uncharacterized protein n=1 Tax=Kocuria subflava TaxID=1736139 RepID=A0A846U7A0_9MICC|nr:MULTISPECIES: hypothetical protein [Kocuria]NKE10671.1 hypothetical protein [Kocuria subflava]
MIDFSPWPGQDADKLRARIAAAETSLREAGYEVTVCLLPDDLDAAESAVRGHFSHESYDAVEVGSGIRVSHDYTLLFERVVNTVVACQPAVPLCLNDSPETTLDAVRRAVTR